MLFQGGTLGCGLGVSSEQYARWIMLQTTWLSALIIGLSTTSPITWTTSLISLGS